ncbi:DNA-directed RNA polymerase subunit delta [Mycoplasmopsis bovirhinis]|uniref:HTH HARE-type domain-containing protein n=1 Tax=Mycoplasmopsis bovirhinis TaxID=29553 RepID=A0A449ACW8_9BACT|nr:hypothetical protein [Mycoplasmopsis bovirhinis]VEU62887.1 Uncharacterised protein [Mycoplasmopsis bovirhinis]
MKNTTMLEVASKFVLDNPNQAFEFYQIFDKVEEELNDLWIKRLLFKSDDNSYEQIRERKMGELYRLLSVDKTFLRNEDGTWSARHKNF